jgi:hypothetical protein
MNVFPYETFPLKILFIANVTPNPNSGAAGTEFQAKALQKLNHTVGDVWADELSHEDTSVSIIYLNSPVAYRNALIRRLQNTNMMWLM